MAVHAVRKGGREGGRGAHTEPAFAVILNLFACGAKKKSGYYRNELVHLSNDEFFANIFN
jgi:hypothetical protein